MKHQLFKQYCHIIEMNFSQAEIRDRDFLADFV